MIVVGNSIISEDIKDMCFACNLKVCKGLCCVEGDYGAPITKKEKKTIEKLLDKVIKILPQKNQTIIKEQGFYALDDENNFVTQTIDGKDCVFAIRIEKDTTICAFQKLFIKGEINFIKPISCHLYPLRITDIDEATIINYHHWNICDSARKEGEKENIPLYKYLKEPLIRRFGQEWYDELLKEIEK